MEQENTNHEIDKPVRLAKEILWEALKNIQNFNENSLVDKQKVTEFITVALGILLELQTSEPCDEVYSSGATNAMEQLQLAADLMDSSNSQEENVTTVKEKLARTLAILYPITKFLEMLSAMPTYPAKAPDEPLEAERRASPRIPIKTDVGLHSETNFFTGFAENISTGGLFIATYDILEIGTRLSVSLSLFGGYHICVPGVVRWVREYNETTPDTMPGIGIQFENLSIQDNEVIESFLAERPPIFFDD
ncbi:MAG: TIGR02266 family protein [Proteobacteria bacterium]|nr:TIGR02266 family protein [Pseudomonadota bacterium]